MPCWNFSNAGFTKSNAQWSNSAMVCRETGRENRSQVRCRRLSRGARHKHTWLGVAFSRI